MAEVQVHFRGAKRRIEREQMDRAWLAWHIAGLSRVDPKKWPKSVESLAGIAKATPQQSDDEIKMALTGLFAAFGGDVEQLEAAHRGEQ